MVRGAVLFLSLSLLAGGALADPVLDQSYLPATTDATAQVSSITISVDWGQTFTVGITGTLTSVDLRISRSTSATSSLVAEIRATTGGLPGSDADILASITVPAASVATSFSLFTFDYTAFSLGVSSGDVLAVVLRSAEAIGTYNWSATQANGYLGGGAFRRLAGGSWGTNASIGDLFFRTFVERAPTDGQNGGNGQVPEPALPALAAVGLALTRLRRVVFFTPRRRLNP